MAVLLYADATVENELFVIKALRKIAVNLWGEIFIERSVRHEKFG